MELCNRCKSINFTLLNNFTAQGLSDSLGSTLLTTSIDSSAEIYVHSPTFRALEQSGAEGGCPFCGLIEHELKYTSYLFGGSDKEGNWRPDHEDSSPVIFRNISRPNGPLSNFGIYCGDRSFNVTCMSISSTCLGVAVPQTI
jgi:hypothetical protein